MFSFYFKHKESSKDVIKQSSFTICVFVIIFWIQLFDVGNPPCEWFISCLAILLSRVKFLFSFQVNTVTYDPNGTKSFQTNKNTSVRSSLLSVSTASNLDKSLLEHVYVISLNVLKIKRTVNFYIVNQKVIFSITF